MTRLVFTNCDGFEHFPPFGFAPMVRLCQFSRRGGVLALRLLGTQLGQRRFSAMVTRHGIADPRAVFGGFLWSAGVRRDAVRFMAGIEPRHTLAAVPAMGLWDKPVLVAWGADDPLFPDGRLILVDDSATYVMLARPDLIVTAITDFVQTAGSDKPGC